jgi:hypothetical protein
MSSIGLNANTYRVTGKYLNFLVDFIVKAKHHPDNLDAKKEQMVEFLVKIKDEASIDPQIQLLSSIIDRGLRSSNDRISPFLEALIPQIQSNDLEHSLPKIEFLVEALDNENSEALAKITGE